MSFGCRTGKISWSCICYSWATYLSGAGEQGTTLLKGFCGIYLTAHVCQTRPLGFLAGVRTFRCSMDYTRHPAFHSRPGRSSLRRIQTASGVSNYTSSNYRFCWF